ADPFEELRLTAVTEMPREAMILDEDGGLRKQATYVVDGSSWQEGIRVTIRGMDDDLADGDQYYEVALSAEVARPGRTFHVD